VIVDVAYGQPNFPAGIPIFERCSCMPPLKPEAPERRPPPRKASPPIVPVEQPSNEEVTAAIEELATAVTDRTFVPAADRYRRLQEIATCVVAEPASDVLVYSLDDGTALDQGATELFIRNVRNRIWLLSDFQEETIQKILREETPDAVLSRPFFEKPTDNLHSATSFREEVVRTESLPASAAGSNIVARNNLGKMFNLYLSKRVALSRSIKDRTWDTPYLQRDLYTEIPAVNAQVAHDRQKAAAASRKETVIRPKPGAALRRLFGR
jgi:hypothetical protein